MALASSPCLLPSFRVCVCVCLKSGASSSKFPWEPHTLWFIYQGFGLRDWALARAARGFKRRLFSPRKMHLQCTWAHTLKKTHRGVAIELANTRTPSRMGPPSSPWNSSSSFATFQSNLYGEVHHHRQMSYSFTPVGRSEDKKHGSLRESVHLPFTMKESNIQEQQRGIIEKANPPNSWFMHTASEEEEQLQIFPEFLKLWRRKTAPNKAYTLCKVFTTLWTLHSFLMALDVKICEAVA